MSKIGTQGAILNHQYISQHRSVRYKQTAMGGVYFRAFSPSLLIAAVCLLCAVVARGYARLIFSDVLNVYAYTAMATSLVGVLIWVFHQVWKCMQRRMDHPLSVCRRRLKPRLALLALPALISPLFLAGYTTAKAAIPRLVSYNWDAAFTVLDRTIFQVDPYVITHWIIGDAIFPLTAFLYSSWGIVLVMVQALIVLYARSRTISIFYMTMLSAWLVGGVWLAFIFASGGPAFAHLFDPSLKGYFDPLMNQIPSDSITGRTQAYLASRLGSEVVEKGGGISAMPSMHVATVVIYVLAAKGTRWFWPAVTFAAVTWILSVHLAFHYAVDGIVSATLVVMLWTLATWLHDTVLLPYKPGRRALQINAAPAG